MTQPKASAGLDSLVDQLLALSDAAEGVGSFEAAYHAVMAALHVADHARDVEQVERVARFALAQEQRLEAVEPPHRLAHDAAEQRGTLPLYRNFQVHAGAVRSRLSARIHLDRHKE
jgi:membrane protein required for beta-lactamase induction